MRIVFTMPLFAVAIAAAGCVIFDHSDVMLTYYNASDSLLCDQSVTWPAGESEPIDASSRECSAEVKPQGKTRWRIGCGDAPASAFDLTVILTVASDGRQIYNKTASCEEWNDAHATLIIKRFGDEFVVTDSLPEG